MRSAPNTTPEAASLAAGGTVSASCERDALQPGPEPGGPDTVTGSPPMNTRPLPARHGGERSAPTGRVLRREHPRIVAYDTDLDLSPAGRIGGWFTNLIDAQIHAELGQRDVAILRTDDRLWLAALELADPTEAAR